MDDHLAAVGLDIVLKDIAHVDFAGSTCFQLNSVLFANSNETRQEPIESEGSGTGGRGRT